MNTVTSESPMDAEAVRRILETIQKTTVDFREADMKRKLMDCQDIRTRGYQHQGNYIEGDKIWYQYKDASVWHGPASVICQRGNVVYVHYNGEERKIAPCRAKTCELRERDPEKKEEQKKEEDENKWHKWIEEGENNKIVKDNEIKEDKMVMTEDG